MSPYTLFKICYMFSIIFAAVADSMDAQPDLVEKPKLNCNDHRLETSQHCRNEPNSMTENYSKTEIPLNIIMELNEFTSNVSGLFHKFMPNVNVEKLLGNDAANTIQNAALVPKAAGCSIENKTVSLKDSDDPSLYYSPPCTRVNRCGGCCSHELLACQPTEVEMIDFQVTVMQYNSDGAFQVKEKKTVTVEQHNKCKCDCIVKEKDCSSSQTYRPNECRCECTNHEDQTKCDEEADVKMWNSDACTCQCREEQECSTGFTFDYSSCGCEPDT
ncbi:vascular endothelial growth factor A-A-like isoform X2 [Adelges cooleyi]|uniref:vascular endothelial growth factor A-A-like isoform X2 n=1 Tax=Adelges cooleyi TaxID=133065 RepID=UPI00217F45E2|nr:vascular endothelial growth factor A-A-like isoform X2 [Adelges cooleyi]